MTGTDPTSPLQRMGVRISQSIRLLAGLLPAERQVLCSRLVEKYRRGFECESRRPWIGATVRRQ
jgi:hypothetical protein